MLHFNKLLLILILTQFTLGCDEITPEPLNSSPDRELTLSGSLSAQVATGDTVTYTLPVEQENIYKISVRRTFGSDPQVRVCEIEGCTPTEGIPFPDANDTFDGTIIWFLTNTSNSPLYIHVGGGDESKYVISAILETTSSGGTKLTADDTYGVVYASEIAEYTLDVTGTATEPKIYQIVAERDIGDITPRACTDKENCDTTSITFIKDAENPIYTAEYTAEDTGILYIFVDGATNSIFHIRGSEQ